MEGSMIVRVVTTLIVSFRYNDSKEMLLLIFTLLATPKNKKIYQN